MIQKQLTQIFFIVGGTLTFAGAIAQLLEYSLAPYIFSLGSAFLIYIQLRNALDSSDADLRHKRLGRIGFFTSLLLALAAYFMFTSSNLWVVAVLIYALSTLTLSFRGN